jgi:hypothetical protein
METPPYPTQPQPPGGQPVQPYGQPPAKSNTGKIIVIVVAVLAVLCLCACLVGVLFFRKVGSSVSQSLQTDPAGVTSAMSTIADFDLPAGFQPATSMSILGVTFGVYEASETQSVLVIFQMPTQMALTDANIQKMEEQMQNGPGQKLENYRMIDEYDATIRGKPGKVIIQEGETNAVAYRQMLVVFQGKGGLAMMSISGPANTWDQAAYDDLVKSIR